MNLVQHHALHRIGRLAIRGLVSLETARRGIALLCMDTPPPEDTEAFAAFTERAAAAWQADMAPVRDAMVAALKAGDTAALERLQAQLPILLEHINERPALADVLGQELIAVFIGSVREAQRDRPIKASSLEQWGGRELFPTDLSSFELRGLSAEFRLRRIFSARTTNAEYVSEIDAMVKQILSGEINVATGRWLLMKKLKQLGYDPETGFPQDMADVPPAEKDSLRDLSSEQRIDLMLKTNVSVARNYARVVEGNTGAARYAFPAWELTRLGRRSVERGAPDSHSVGWQRRWSDAGSSVDWQGAAKGTMIALKDSPIWPALGDGAGGYEDTLGHPFPPFAFNSGMGWLAVGREQWLAVAGVTDAGPGSLNPATTGPMIAQLSPTRAEAKKVLDGLGADFRKAMLKELEDIAA